MLKGGQGLGQSRGGQHPSFCGAYSNMLNKGGMLDGSLLQLSIPRRGRSVSMKT